MLVSRERHRVYCSGRRHRVSCARQVKCQLCVVELPQCCKPFAFPDPAGVLGVQPLITEAQRRLHTCRLGHEAPHCRPWLCNACVRSWTRVSGPTVECMLRLHHAMCYLRCASVLRGSAPKTPVGPEWNRGRRQKVYCAGSTTVSTISCIQPPGLRGTAATVRIN